MNYSDIYHKLIEKAKTRTSIEGYFEIHHIIPKCLGGLDNEENLVSLTPEEHFLAHQLLVKMHPNNYKLVLAVNLMCISNTTENMNRINNKQYGWIKRKLYKQIKLKCEFCESTFYRSPSLIGRYCSKSCFYKSMKNTITCSCSRCGGQFETTPYKFNHGRMFCSKACQNDNDKVKIQCANCNSTFSVIPSRTNAKFCSNECRTAYTKPIKVSCEICSCEFETYKVKPKKYCSRDCYKLSKKGKPLEFMRD